MLVLAINEVTAAIREFRIETEVAREWTRSGRGKLPKKKESFAAGVGRGMRRAARTARQVARMYGTQIYVWKNGKVIAKDPNDDAK